MTVVGADPGAENGEDFLGGLAVRIDEGVVSLGRLFVPKCKMRTIYNTVFSERSFGNEGRECTVEDHLLEVWLDCVIVYFGNDIGVG